MAGIAAACGQQWRAAEEHYREALRQAHDLSHKIEQPEVRRWYARMLLDRDGPGDPRQARDHHRRGGRKGLQIVIGNGLAVALEAVHEGEVAR